MTLPNAFVVVALMIAASFAVIFPAFVIYIYSLPAHLDVHAPLVDGPVKN